MRYINEIDELINSDHGFEQIQRNYETLSWLLTTAEAAVTPPANIANLLALINKELDDCIKRLKRTVQEAATHENKVQNSKG